MIIEDQSFEIALNEGVAARRRIGFQCVRDEDGVSPYPSLTFSGAELKVGKNFTEASYSGSATEIADGFYRYECSAGETDTLGSLSLRTNKTGVRPIMVFTQIIGGLPSVPTNFHIINNDAGQLAAPAFQEDAFQGDAFQA